MLRGTLEDFGCSFSHRETHSALGWPWSPPLRGREGHLPLHLYCSIFTSVNSAVCSSRSAILKYSVLPCRLSFESERLTEDGGDVPSGEPREPVLRFSSRLLFVHHAVYQGISSLGSGAGFRHGFRGLPYVL